MRAKPRISQRNLIILIIAIILLIIIGITITMARYRSTGIVGANAEIAFYVVKEGHQEGNIMLSGLYPSTTPFEYEFTVANFDGSNVAETTLDYTLELKMTTNLPLEVKVFKNGNELTNTADIENNIVLDESGQNYIRKINIKTGRFIFNESKTDTYKISATFPIGYSANEEYQNIIDHVAVLLDAKQKID